MNFLFNNRIVWAGDFTRDHADELRAILVNSGVKPKTINFYIVTAKALFTDLFKTVYVLKNPFDHVKMEKIKKKTMKVLEDDY